MTRTPRREQKPDTRMSLYDERAGTPQGMAALAAAEAALQVQALVERAFEQSGLTSREVAAALGVSEGRISQIRHSDGNLKLGTISRLLSVLGLRLRLSTVRARATRDETVFDDFLRSTSQRWEQLFACGSGVHIVSYAGTELPTDATPLGEPVERYPRRDAGYIAQAEASARARHEGSRYLVGVER